MPGPDDTEVFVPDRGKSRGRDLPQARSFAEPGIDICAATHVGYGRANNEDQFAVVRRTRTSRLLASSLPPEAMPDLMEHAHLMLVADGLGGQAFGELASQTALQVIQQMANKVSDWIMKPEHTLDKELEQKVDAYLRAIQDDLVAQARRNPAVKGMATTVTGAYVFGRQAIVCSIGDSRAYLFHKGQLEQITSDHTMAEEMRVRGAPASTHVPYRNVLTRCISTDVDPVKADIFQLDLHDGDLLLLCTDGLTDMVADRELGAIFAAEPEAKQCCERLVKAALSNGGHDNVTVVLSRFRFES